MFIGGKYFQIVPNHLEYLHLHNYGPIKPSTDLYFSRKHEKYVFFIIFQTSPSSTIVPTKSAYKNVSFKDTITKRCDVIALSLLISKI